jgi:hypothetical protein
MAGGWKLHVIEWEQEEQLEALESASSPEGVPYGLEVVSGALHLKQNPHEIAVLLTILEMIVRDESVPLIANELNQRNFRTRAGGSWSAPAVFDLLPRVIEMGPTLLRSQEWISRRPVVVAR